MSGPVAPQRYRWQPLSLAVLALGIGDTLLLLSEGGWRPSDLRRWAAGLLVGLAWGVATHIRGRRRGWGGPLSREVRQALQWGGLGAALMFAKFAPAGLQLLVFALATGWALPLCYAPGDLLRGQRPRVPHERG